ncbi:MAG TPA: hypothetical protein VGV36_04600 [Solirubrobacteraceae bacterium]|nr:hypothetical protein [Solirubrobacteraceae bacterium]
MSSLAFLLASAEEAGSPVAFYVTGLVLVVFALVVSAVGIKRPGFVSGKGAARALMAVSVVLVGLVMVASVVTAG